MKQHISDIGSNFGKVNRVQHKIFFFRYELT